MKKVLPYIVGAGIILLLLRSTASAQSVNGKSIMNGIYGMKRSSFVPPYNSDGSTTLPNVKNKSGIYIIKEDNQIVYIGYSANNLYRTLYRHFQQWTGGRGEAKAGTTYVNKMNRHTYTVRAVITTPTQDPRLEAALIEKHQPRDNELKLIKYAEDKTAGAVEVEKYQQAEDLNTPPPF